MQLGCLKDLSSEPRIGDGGRHATGGCQGDVSKAVPRGQDVLRRKAS